MYIHQCVSNLLSLENVLRNYSALGVGESIRIHHNGKDYFLNVTQVKPFNVFNAVAILDVDLTIDFEPPLDYVEPSKPQPVSIPHPSVSQPISSEENNKPTKPSPSTSPSKDEKKFAAFSGQGYSLSGSKSSDSSISSSSQMSVSPSKLSAPKSKPISTVDSDSEEDDSEDSNSRKFKAFSGKGYSLK